MTPRPATVWLLLGPRAGEVAQQRALAAAVGAPWVEKPVFLKDAGDQPGFGFRPGMAAAFGLTAPWPRVVIAFGKTLPAARWVRAASGGASRIVLLGRPRRAALTALDLVLPMPQDSMPPADNVLPLKLPLNRPPPPDPAALEQWRLRLAALPRPWRLLLIGGSTRHFRLEPATIAAAVRALAAEGGSLLVSTSPRTPGSLVDTLRSTLEVSGAPHALNLHRPGGRDAYAEFLALADDAVLTGDSASMVADCLRSGFAVRIVPLEASPALRRRRALRRLVPAAIEARLARRGWLSATVDLDRWLHSLAAIGVIGFVGESRPGQGGFAAWDDDLDRVVPRVRALL